MHVSYSEKHFHPERERTERFNYTAGQTAYHLWEAVKSVCPDATYGDAIPRGPLDLLWAQSPTTEARRANRVLWIQTGPHPGFQNRAIEAAMAYEGAADRKSLLRMRELHPVGDLWTAFHMAGLADAVLLKGNCAILEGWQRGCRPFANKFQLFDNGVVPERHRDLGYSRQALSFVYPATRFCLRKGSHLVAEAWRAFQRTHPEATLTLMGREGDFDLGSRLADVPGVRNSGPFSCGDPSQIDLLNKAQFVFFPSLAEGQAGTLLEAMSCGCIPVATRTSGVDAGGYGGIEIRDMTPIACLDGLTAAATIDPVSARSLLASQMEQRHRWPIFRERVGSVMEQVLSATPVAKPSRAHLWLQFWLHRFPGGLRA